MLHLSVSYFNFQSSNPVVYVDRTAAEISHCPRNVDVYINAFQTSYSKMVHLSSFLVILENMSDQILPMSLLFLFRLENVNYYHFVGSVVHFAG